MDALLKLSPAQSLLLRTAARRADGRVVPPDTLRGGARVTQQIVAALSAPHMLQAVWDRIRETRPEMSEPEVVLPMRNLAGLWQQLFPAEQYDWRSCLSSAW